MALLLDTLLFQRADFKDFRDISDNLPDERIVNYIRESQVKDLRTFLGPELYLKLLNDYNAGTDTFATQRFTDLYFGVDYTVGTKTIRFNGLKAAHIYLAYKRMLQHQQVSVTRYGVKSMQTEFSEDILADKIRRELIDTDSMAKVYTSQAEAFLHARLSVYPEYRNEETDADKTGLRFTKVVGTNYYYGYWDYRNK